MVLYMVNMFLVFHKVCSNLLTELQRDLVIASVKLSMNEFTDDVEIIQIVKIN